jgi:NAD-dependent dihydropyrimidine dehydrogenase PreA subunit
MKYRYLKNVATLRLDEDRCVGCGMCLEVCPHEVLESAGKKVRARDMDACMECGACAINCPSGAINVRAGVGCAYALIKGSLTGGKPTCCSGGTSCERGEVDNSLIQEEGK